MAQNPYHVPSIQQAKQRSAAQGGGSSTRSRTVAQLEEQDPGLYSSKAVAEEIRRDDAAMADEVAALRMNRVQRTYNPAGTANSSARGTSGGGGGGDTAASVEFTQNMTTAEYIQSKRELGLVRMSLATKRAEIRKLEDEIDRAEKKLHQQQDQLENTREKFNSFLKHSNLEQDAAVRRANDEARAKQEKTVEIKKISARIGHAEMDTRKILQQVANCREYKRFLNELTKAQWFYDTLIDLRVTDRTDEILLAAEQEYGTRMAELERRHEEAVRAREEAEKNPKKEVKYRSRQQQQQAEQQAAQQAAETEVPLEQQLDELHAEIEQQAQARVDEATDAIVKEVQAMTAEDVHRALDAYPEERIPLYFETVDKLLEVFVNVEEGNLFLIQNCQELEEELDAVAMDFLTEKNEMTTMNEQRHGQMKALSAKIAESQTRLSELQERHEALNSKGKKEDKPTNRSAPGAVFDKSTVESVVAKTINNKSSGEPTADDLSPEDFKKRVESKINGIFATLTSGEASIKALAAAAQQAADTAAGQNAEGGLDGTVQSSTAGGSGAGKSNNKNNTTTSSGSKSATARSSSKTTGNANQSSRGSTKGQGGTQGGRSRSATTGGANGGAGGKSGNSAAAGGANGNGGAHAGGAPGGDAGPNIGPVELLTIIENKLDEYHRFITNPANGVDPALVVSVMKQSDKERRRAARQQHMARQAAEQEERVKRALERAQAPVERRVGKPVLLRSHYTSQTPQDSTKKRSKSNADNEYDENDGAEFFV